MNFRYSIWHYAAWLLLVVAGVGCAYVAKLPTVMPPVHLPPEAINRLGDWAFQLLLKTVDVSQNASDKEQVSKVANRIIKAAEGSKYADAAKQFKWEWTVIRDDEKRDAFALPGGKIGVYTGLLRFTGENEAKLAVALAHEAVHALAQHAGERISRMSEELRRELAFAATGSQLLKEKRLSPQATAGVMVAMGLTYQGAVMFPFIREQESEADHVGLLLMARAGYNPQEAIDFWQQMGDGDESSGSRMPEFLSTHLGYETRIKQLKDWMPEALTVLREQ